MGKPVENNNVILLFDRYNIDSKRLHKSFKLAKCSFPAVSIEENGFLPEDVCSIYSFFLGDYKNAPNIQGRPRYFNEIEIPDYWYITASGTMGTVYDQYHERARIFYIKQDNKRQVQTVDWLDESGMPRYSDHYNKYGAIYARTTMDSNGHCIVKSYFSPDGKEVIVENFVTRNIILNTEKGPVIFKDKTELAVYFFHVSGYDKKRIFYNSLSTPFFVSCILHADKKNDVLFWQEPVGDEIPGNMMMILDGRTSCTEKILVQKRDAHKRLLELGANPEIAIQKGFIYPFCRKNKYRPEALICTNSDQIEQCEKIVSALPQVKFHIAALTEMSAKLMAMQKHENVHLYPGIKADMARELFYECDVYLDINHSNEIVSAVYRAFLHNQVIFAFSNTVHNKDIVPEQNIYAPEQADQMIEKIRNVLADKKTMEDMLEKQKAFAMAENAEEFLKI